MNVDSDIGVVASDIYQDDYIQIRRSPGGSIQVSLYDVFQDAYRTLLSDSLTNECSSPDLDRPSCFIKAVPLSKYLDEAMMRQLPYMTSLKLFRDLTSQLTALEERGNKVPAFIKMDDVYVFESSEPEYDNDVHIQFLFMNGGRLCDIDQTTSMIMNTVGHEGDDATFASPEYKKIATFPSPVHKNSWMYSVGLILCKCIRGSYKKSREVIPDIGTVTLEVAKTHFIDNIELTPLYYAIQRCLRESPEKRSCLLL